MGPLDLVNLTPLMQRTSGRAGVKVALIDGPVAIDHPDLVHQSIRALGPKSAGTCSMPDSAACVHGTFVAGVLSAKRASSAPAICPQCTLLVRPIFSEGGSAPSDLPSAKPEELAAALMDSINSHAQLINLSAALSHSSTRGERALEEALSFAAQRNVIVVVAAGNHGTIGSSLITRHPWVIPVAGCDSQGKPVAGSNLGRSIGRNGLSAPAESITSLSTDGHTRAFCGTSAAAPFVSGTIALLWSEYPGASATQIKLSLGLGNAVRRNTIIPPLLDSWGAYQTLGRAHNQRGML